MACFLGIDVGSATTKLVLMDDDQIIGHSIVPTGVDCEASAGDELALLLRQCGLERQDITNIASTGYGRKLIGFAEHTISEITANLKGAVFMMKQTGNSIPGTIINIGGQDSKVIAVNAEGLADNFLMNDKCAAGTGRFLETVSRILDVPIEELGAESLQADAPLRINSTCAVFAESEIISLVARKKGVSEIIAGAHCAIARRISKMVKSIGMKKSIFFDGGPAMNAGMVRALEMELDTDVFVPETPQITTALGAALTAKENGL